MFTMSRPVWGAWIEIRFLSLPILPASSRPVWGAWIEIAGKGSKTGKGGVAPRMGRVD